MMRALKTMTVAAMMVWGFSTAAQPTLTEMLAVCPAPRSTPLPSSVSWTVEGRLFC